MSGKPINLVLQLVGLIALNEIGHFATDLSGLPVPGNLLGMLLLLGLLLTGWIPLRWIEAGSSLLVRHLAFFFIPIAVGLMGYASLFVREGLAVAASLVMSALAGLWIAGWITQRFGTKGASHGAERARDGV